MSLQSPGPNSIHESSIESTCRFPTHLTEASASRSTGLSESARKLDDCIGSNGGPVHKSKVGRVEGRGRFSLLAPFKIRMITSFFESARFSGLRSKIGQSTQRNEHTSSVARLRPWVQFSSSERQHQESRRQAGDACSLLAHCVLHLGKKWLMAFDCFYASTKRSVKVSTAALKRPEGFTGISRRAVFSESFNSVRVSPQVTIYHHKISHIAANCGCYSDHIHFQCRWQTTTIKSLLKAGKNSWYWTVEWVFAPRNAPICKNSLFMCVKMSSGRSHSLRDSVQHALRKCICHWQTRSSRQT